VEPQALVEPHIASAERQVRRTGSLPLLSGLSALQMQACIIPSATYRRAAGNSSLLQCALP